MKQKIVLGIAGGLGAGKTTVTDLLVQKGAVKIDADRAGHRILENGNIKEEIVKRLGEEILSGGAIDRARLRKLVFTDKSRLEILNSIVHPLILERIKKEVDGISGGVVVIDAALLVEMGVHELVDLFVLVDAGREVRLERAQMRGISRDEAERIIDSQADSEEARNLADHVIDNNNDMAILKEGVDELWRKVQGL